MTGICRACGSSLATVVADLGMQPLSNSYLRLDELDRMEPHYPLAAFLCEQCFLVQLSLYESPTEIFAADYAYFSSYSDSWLRHCQTYVEQVVPALGLDSGSRVVEVASNDGYLLQYFVERGISAHGVEPAAGVAEVARAKGVPTTVAFFGAATACQLRDEDGPADLLIGNNVLAHVPDLNDFVEGLRILLAPAGTVTMEFPHLLRLMAERQFDTIYHEHFSYFSLRTVRAVFAAHGLRVLDVQELSTHGGSLRIWAGHRDDARPDSPAIASLQAREGAAGLGEIQTYTRFADAVRREKRQILRFFLDVADRGESIAGYGAPAKGNTLLNYCGLGPDFLPFTVDRNPHKQGTFLPGSHIPVLSPEALDEATPDLVLILPWNIRTEVEQQLAHVRAWGGRFVARAPDLRVT